MGSDPVARVLLGLILVCLAILVAQGFATSGAGRYSVAGVRAGAPLLIRTDTVTGQVWKLSLRDSDSWVAFREPVAAEEPPAAAPPAPPDAAR